MNELKKILKWAVIGMISLSVLFFLLGSRNTQQNTPTTTSKETTTSHISKEQFNVYQNILSNLENLQDEYEQLYAKYGYVDLKQAANIEGDNFPQYGSLTRKITSVRDIIPKIKTSMSSDERDLSLQLSSYATSLIFLSAKKDGIEGLDVANEEKETFKQLLNRVKDSNGF